MTNTKEKKIACTLCKDEYSTEELIQLEDNLFFHTCNECQASHLVFVEALFLGRIMIITQLTDLQEKEALKKLNNKTISVEDVLEVSKRMKAD